MDGAHLLMDYETIWNQEDQANEIPLSEIVRTRRQLEDEAVIEHEDYDRISQLCIPSRLEMNAGLQIGLMGRDHPTTVALLGQRQFSERIIHPSSRFDRSLMDLSQTITSELSYQSPDFEQNNLTPSLVSPKISPIVPVQSQSTDFHHIIVESSIDPLSLDSEQTQIRTTDLSSPNFDDISPSPSPPHPPSVETVYFRINERWFELSLRPFTLPLPSISLFNPLPSPTIPPPQIRLEPQDSDSHSLTSEFSHQQGSSHSLVNIAKSSSKLSVSSSTDLRPLKNEDIQRKDSHLSLLLTKSKSTLSLPRIDSKSSLVSSPITSAPNPSSLPSTRLPQPPTSLALPSSLLQSVRMEPLDEHQISLLLESTGLA
ncbi:hypothetical protein BLNAU_16587 [Blattamonas nauphoetae]|uniref:Uncharacterized protein n=1 Tax=Blattamonas nauphoetae TaxID=2049346 RepID=A0ABQ9X876_9EUKA|nr:hypothetical protein BLNAU_16587 [Blattamonas nauphoetae]